MFVDNALEANPVAGFLTLMRNFVQGSPVNQDSLVRTNAIATLSYLLQKVIKISSNYLTDYISCFFCVVNALSQKRKPHRFQMGFQKIRCAKADNLKKLPLKCINQ